jgi:hypothetical protein
MKKTKSYLAAMLLLLVGIFFSGSRVEAADTCATQLSTCVGAAKTTSAKTACNDQYTKCTATTSAANIITVTNEAVTREGQTLPAGTTINTATGVATLPGGAKINVTQPNIDYFTANGFDSLSVTNNPGSNTGLANNQSAAGVNSVGCENGEKIGGVCFPNDTGLSDASITDILENLFSWLMGLFTTLAVMAFVVSGVQYLTAAGNEDSMEAGKRNVQYSMLGILVGLSGFVVVRAIAAALSGTSIFF